jgi:solute:Na+ symporter, SSS family
VSLSIIDGVIIVAYLAFTVAVGGLLKRYTRTSTDFFLAGRAIPAWVCGLAFISANLGAQEVVGMAASGAKYGIATSHFYWIGAIPAMVFVGLLMMPFYTHAWDGLGSSGTNPLGIEWFGLVMGLGFVLSFGYWCTDFLVVQRAMAADSMEAARRTAHREHPEDALPIPRHPARADRHCPAHQPVREPANSQAAPALAISAPGGQGVIPPKLDERTGQPELDADGHAVLDYDLAVPNMLLHYFPAGLLGLGLVALLASFMSGMAGNVTAFNTVWTYDIYQSYIHKGASDAHYLWMGRMATIFGVAFSVFAAYFAVRFNNIMDVLQLVFAFVNAPLFTTFLLGMFWKRATGDGAFWGVVLGTSAAAIHHGLTLPAGAQAGLKGGWLGTVVHQYASQMAHNFWTAIWAWSVCFVGTLFISLLTRPREERELVGLVYSLTQRISERHLAWYKRPVTLGVGVLLAAATVNWAFW